MKDDQKRAFLAVLISGLILFGWQYFYAPKTDYSSTMKKSDNVVEAKKEEADIVEEKNAIIKEVKTKALSTFVLKNEKSFYEISNTLSLFKATSFENDSNFNKYFNKNTYNIFFNFSESFKTLSFDYLEGDASRAVLVNKENNLKVTININEKGFLNYNFSSSTPFSYKIIYNLVKTSSDGGSMFAFSQPKSMFGYYTNDYNSVPFSSEDSGDKKFKWASVDNEYHMLATIFDEKTPFIFKITEGGEFSLYTNKKSKELKLNQIFTRKEYDYLKGLGNNLDLSIDFGFVGIIAIPILRGLQFFYTLIPNYGIAIILLTIIIRFLTFPLQYKSFKSMKKMQEIQPQLNKVREKFKDNPQKMQQETMALFKKSGANPLGGCLPLVLQMPIFFAFYRVLYSSVELVDAPFYFWISDLSQKDPFYVLPILMAVAMVLNQRLMPTTTTDPVQKKIMMFVPLIFAIFMKDFPAGLTLYIFISTMVGMLQQLYVYRKA
jgi:YidC/Oxa1 family membrane protein insertase